MTELNNRFYTHCITHPKSWMISVLYDALATGNRWYIKTFYSQFVKENVTKA